MSKSKSLILNALLLTFYVELSFIVKCERTENLKNPNLKWNDSISANKFASANVNVDNRSAYMTTINNGNDKVHLKFAVLLPEKPAKNSDIRILSTVRPVIEMATKKLTREGGLLENFAVDIEYRDTQCSSTYGALGAFDIYRHKEPGVRLNFKNEPKCFSSE